MDIPWRYALVVVAILFLTFVAAKIRPSLARRAKAGRPYFEARDRLRNAKTPEERATALCDAADAVVSMPLGRVRAAAYLHRAMRAHPEGVEPIARAEKTLRRRPRLLAGILWRRLSGGAWDEAHEAANEALLSALASIHQRDLRDKAQARFLSRLRRGESLFQPSRTIPAS